MKQTHFLFALMLCCVWMGCNEKKGDAVTVTITGQLIGVEDSVVVNLMKPKGYTSVPQLADTIENGSFRFSYADTLNFPKRMLINVYGEGFPPTFLEIWVAPGADIKITGKDKMLRCWDVKSNVPEQMEFNQYKSKVDKYEKISQPLMVEAFSYFDSINYQPARRMEFGARVDSLYKMNDSLRILISKTEIDIMEANKTYSPVWMNKFVNNASSLKYIKLPKEYVEKLKKMYEEMPDKMKNSEEGGVVFVNLN